MSGFNYSRKIVPISSFCKDIVPKMCDKEIVLAFIHTRDLCRLYNTTLLTSLCCIFTGWFEKCFHKCKLRSFISAHAKHVQCKIRTKQRFDQEKTQTTQKMSTFSSRLYLCNVYKTHGIILTVAVDSAMHRRHKTVTTTRDKQQYGTNAKPGDREWARL